MDIDIEKELLKFSTHIIDYASLKSILANMGYLHINDKIHNLSKKGIIKSIKRGLYFHSSKINKNIISNEILANNILGPSYISFDYALSYYGIIPEVVNQITCATTKRSKKYNTSFGVFSYKQINKELFSVGLRIATTNNGNFLIASKEKAICDKIYFTKDVQLTSKNTIFDFLENDLRIDLYEIEDIDNNIIDIYAKITKSKKIAIFNKLIKEL